MKHSESIAKIAPALVAALSKIEGAQKSANNGHFKTKYADLGSVIDASRDILTAHGLTVLQFPGACQGGVMNLETVLLHESGEYISETMGIALGKTDPQGVGSALTYGRRYAQMAALNMPTVDDDGEVAMGRGGVQTQAVRTVKQDKSSQDNTRPEDTALFGACKAAMDLAVDEASLARWAEDNKSSMQKMLDDSPAVHKAVRNYYAQRLQDFRHKAAA